MHLYPSPLHFIALSLGREQVTSNLWPAHFQQSFLNNIDKQPGVGPQLEHYTNFWPISIQCPWHSNPGQIYSRAFHKICIQWFTQSERMTWCVESIWWHIHCISHRNSNTQLFLCFPSNHAYVVRLGSGPTEPIYANGFIIYTSRVHLCLSVNTVTAKRLIYDPNNGCRALIPQ